MLSLSTRNTGFTFFLMVSSQSQALEITSELQTIYGYDDNINQEEDTKKTASHFLGIVPVLSVVAQTSDRVTAEGGYELAYTQYLRYDQNSRVHHLGWGEVMTRIKPGLFTSFSAKVESLEDKQNSDDDGWGYSLATGLTSHVSNKLSAKISASYSRWQYDSLYFDTGRVVIQLDNRQKDDHYEGKIGLAYQFSPNIYFNGTYQVAYNDSNNTIDEYNTNTILTDLSIVVGNNTILTLGYDIGKQDYDNWRAGKKLKGKLRDDTQHHYLLGLEYSYSPFADLFFDFNMTRNNSNLEYQSYNRQLVYGGIRLTW